MNKEIILGTPFLALLYPFRVDEEGLKTVYKDQEICFKFISSLRMKELNVYIYCSKFQQSQDQNTMNIKKKL